MLKVKLAFMGLCAAALALAAGAAQAAAGPVDPSKVQALAAQIEAALEAAGPNATADDDVKTIQSVIAASGASPSEAEAAIEVVEHAAGLSANASIALASVDKEIEYALAGSVAAAGGGPAGGPSIGGPPSYVSGGGSDYLVR